MINAVQKYELRARLFGKNTTERHRTRNFFGLIGIGLIINTTPVWFLVLNIAHFLESRKTFHQTPDKRSLDI